MQFILLSLVLVQSPDSTVKSDLFTQELQGKAIEASPKVAIRSGVNTGTGSSVIVWVSDGYFTPSVAYALTAAHVVKDNAKVDLDFFLRRQYSGVSHSLYDVEVVASTVGPDVALLKIQLTGRDPVPVPIRLAAPGARPKHFAFQVLSVGCDDGGNARCALDLVLAKRLIHKPNRLNEIGLFWETQNTSRPGRSGGPMIDGSFRVIGICAANQDNLGYFVHIDEIHAWLKQLRYEWLWKD